MGVPYSPVHTTYTTGSPNLNLTFDTGAGVVDTLTYDIDGKYEGPIPLVFNETPGFHLTALGTGFVQLPTLSNGNHQLIIYLEAELTDYHGANPPGAPFTETAPGSANYTANWAYALNFTVESSSSQVVNATVVDLSPTALERMQHPFPTMLVMGVLAVATVAVVLAIMGYLKWLKHSCSPGVSNQDKPL